MFELVKFLLRHHIHFARFAKFIDINSILVGIIGRFHFESI